MIVIGHEVNVSYVRSSARGDLNALMHYFGSTMWPVIGENAYGPEEADVPHRLLLRGRAMPTERWLLTGIFDWRSGRPYSVVDEYRDFVGARNEGHRFPAYARVQIGLEHRFKILNKHPWIGVRVFNALNTFLPTDVQNNIGSPAFGSFCNSEYRQFRLQVRFER